jgi:serine kinase of HPr protein (carbohydrate metabolism regulator)
MQTINIHASCVVLGPLGHTFGAPEESGVLILGPSGSGKSDLALRLIERGALLVADDRVDLYADGGRLWARAPTNLAGLMEVRGVGIVAMPHRPEATIAIAISLVPSQDVPRKPEHGMYSPPPQLGLPQNAWPPLVKLVASESSAAAKVALAAAAFANALFREDGNST